jgi:DeoR family transcriptional regulator, glycerol-3-phosphate regulon repressor
MVDELSVRFDVTPQTIRKDLNDLCSQRLLARVHGGAIISSGSENVGLDMRLQIAPEEKLLIGKAAAALVPEHASVFIAIGTTTKAVAQALLQHEGLMVITNDLSIAEMMRPYPNIEVTVVCGTVRRADGGIVGEAAVEFVSQFRVDHAIIGASAIDTDGMLLDFDFREVKVTQKVMSNARSVILAADALKFERSAPVEVGHIGDVGTFVTDRCASDGIRRILEKRGVALVETMPEPIDA